MKNLPFKLSISTDIEQWRKDTFWDKEPETLNWIESFENGEIFYDVGANIGIYSLYAASLFPQMDIYAFEPFKINYDRLFINVELNQYSRIYPFLTAISDEVKIVDFYTKSNVAGSSGGQLYAPVSDKGRIFKSSDVLEVITTTLDSFTDRFLSKNNEEPTYIKIDVDGLEHKIVLGMEKVLKMNKLQSILIEINKYSDIQEAQAIEIDRIMRYNGFTDDNEFNDYPIKSDVRRNKEGILAKNIIYTKKD
ncbi:MAG: FkbM family methyltransferase [Spirochaetota bacterium]|nr:FkbM family methyltransferase [Spirochaetota bacterium]